MLNVYEQIDRNKKRSFLVILFFIVFVTGFIWALGSILGSDQNIIILAAIMSFSSSAIGYFWGDKIVLAVSGAKPANKEDHFDFFTSVENLSIAAQIPMPKLYVINSPAMNAFAAGRNPNHALVCATTGLLNNLNKTELEGVIAHEISHITNYDILLMTLVSVLVGMITLISDWFIRGGLRQSKTNKNRSENPIVFALGIISLIISPIIAKLIQLALSRQRELFADSSAVKLTRQPMGLISALKKLNQSRIPLSTARSATAHLFITNPFGKISKGLSKINNLFSTHPPIEIRLKNLQKML